MARETEYREVQVEDLRSDDATGEIRGYAAVFDQRARIWDFDEVIQRGAFAKTIKDGADVFAFWNHDSGAILGRRKNGTLTLEEDDHGLRVGIKPPDTPTAQEVRQLIRDGFIDKMSIGFEVVRQKWTDGETALREIIEAKLFEVSPVPIPAYDGTTVAARGHKPERPEAAPEKCADAVPSVDTSPAEPARPTGSTLQARFMLKLRETETKEG